MRIASSAGLIPCLGSRGGHAGNLPCGHDFTHASNSSETAMTALRMWALGRRTGSPNSSHRCTVRTPRLKCSAISFQPLRIISVILSLFLGVLAFPSLPQFGAYFSQGLSQQKIFLPQQSGAFEVLANPLLQLRYRTSLHHDSYSPTFR